MFEDLKGRTAIVFGVANKRSIAWAIAQGLHAAGANLAITYQNERMEMEAKDLILSLPGAEAFMCDVSKDDEIAQLFEKLKARYGKLHALVHSVAFAPEITTMPFTIRSTFWPLPVVSSAIFAFVPLMHRSPVTYTGTSMTRFVPLKSTSHPVAWIAVE